MRKAYRKQVPYGKFCSPHQARTRWPPRRADDSFSQYLSIFLQLCERLAVRDVVVNPSANFRISTVSSWACYLYISRRQPFRIVCKNVLFCNCKYLVMTKKITTTETFAPIICSFGACIAERTPHTVGETHHLVKT